MSLHTVSTARPSSGAQWASILALQPSRDAVRVERMIALSPHWLALRVGITHAHWARLTEVLLANSAVLDLGVPSPHSNCIPFLKFKDLLLCVHYFNNWRA